MKTRIEELREQLAAKNKGLHYLKQTHETECVEQLCAELDALRAQLRDLTDQLAARDGVIARLKEHLGEIRNPLTSYVHGDNELTPADINGMLDETDTALSITSAAYADKLREAEAELTAMRGLLETVQRIAEDSPELNMSNYDHEQVCALNDAMIELVNCARARLATERKEDV